MYGHRFWMIACIMLIPAFVQAAETKVTMAKATPEQATFFENKVRPLLSESCFRCHGGDPKKEQGRAYVDFA